MTARPDTNSEDKGHVLVNPDTMFRPSGHAHAVLAAGGRVVAIAGQNGHGPDGRLPDGGMVEHFDWAADAVVKALAAVGARPEHIVSMQIFVTNREEYAEAMKHLGPVYRKHFGRHYPAMGVFVTGLLDPDAKVELMPIAVIPDAGHDGAAQR
jgi:enamine deaminase RidA (YjgF/YER057c/UK114 family)